MFRTEVFWRYENADRLAARQYPLFRKMNSTPVVPFLGRTRATKARQQPTEERGKHPRPTTHARKTIDGLRTGEIFRLFAGRDKPIPSISKPIKSPERRSEAVSVPLR